MFDLEKNVHNLFWLKKWQKQKVAILKNGKKNKIGKNKNGNFEKTAKKKTEWKFWANSFDLQKSVHNVFWPEKLAKQKVAVLKKLKKKK